MDRADSTTDQYQQAATELEHWLASKAAEGVPELVLESLLQRYTARIASRGYVPRSWHAQHGAPNSLAGSVARTHSPHRRR